MTEAEAIEAICADRRCSRAELEAIYRDKHPGRPAGGYEWLAWLGKQPAFRPPWHGSAFAAVRIVPLVQPKTVAPTKTSPPVQEKQLKVATANASSSPNPKQ